MRIVAKLACLAGCLTLLNAGTAFADEAGSIAEGRRYVETMCADCHGVRAGERRSPMAEAPAFQAVADQAETTGMALAAWLLGPHVNMPNIMVVEPDRQNVIAYILSLKRP